MPPKKCQGPPSRIGRQTLSKRMWTSELTATDPPVPEPTISNPGLVSLDVNALSATISTAISEAVKTALSKDSLTEILRQNTVDDSSSIEATLTGRSQADLPSENVTPAVSSHVSSLIGAGTSNDSLLIGPDNVQPKQIFTSVSVKLSSRVGSKIKAKIWANEYVKFGALLASTPQVDKYALSMTPSTAPSKQLRQSLEPYQATKKVYNIQQWVTNIFVSLYTERYQSETPQLMKYCEVVRDIASSNGDWLWYDEQFRYLRQSAPDKYPWDQIHWELWLRASTNFRRSQSITNKPQTSTRWRFCSNFSPEVRVGPFMPENTAKGVSLNTFFTSVEQNTQQFSAPCKPLSSVLVELNQKETLLKYQALHSSPVTPVRVERLECLLHCYDHNKEHFLVDGFRCGFRVNFVGDRLPYESPNLKSVLDQPEIARIKLHKECNAGRIVGLLSTPPFANFRTSPLGVIPKKDPSKFRLIHRLSYPKGNSVNDAIPDYCSSVKYVSVSDAITAIKAIGEGSFLAKTDIKSAFHIISIYPADYSLLGMKFDNLYYFDRCLPMGLSSSCNKLLVLPWSGCLFIAWGPHLFCTY